MAAPTVTTDAARATDPAVAKAMKTLTAQWYNAVVAGCGLDPDTFQLAQGAEQIGSTSEELWNTLDALPPGSLTHQWNESRLDLLSAHYGDIVNNLVPERSGDFRRIMADDYPRWMDYLHGDPPPKMPDGGILQLFHDWAQVNMAPDDAQAAYTAWQQVAQGTVPAAVGLWVAAGGQGATKAYDRTIAELEDALRPGAPGKTVVLDSTTTSKSVDHTWASGEVGGVLEFFAGEASEHWDKYTKAVSAAGVRIDAEFERVVSFPAGPLSKASTNPDLEGYKPWFHGPALSLAYKENNYDVWERKAPSWDDEFGPEGVMRYFVTELVVVSGVTVTTTSATTFTEKEREEVRASAAYGFFPFFEGEHEGGWKHQFSFSDSGALTVKSTVDVGVPILLGANVTSVARQFG